MRRKKIGDCTLILHPTCGGGKSNPGWTAPYHGAEKSNPLPWILFSSLDRLATSAPCSFTPGRSLSLQCTCMLFALLLAMNKHKYIDSCQHNGLATPFFNAFTQIHCPEYIGLHACIYPMTSLPLGSAKTPHHKCEQVYSNSQRNAHRPMSPPLGGSYGSTAVAEVPKPVELSGHTPKVFARQF